jgi:hypothetical protein
LLLGIAALVALQSPVATAAGSRWVVILVGIPGDAGYEQKYKETADNWERSFSQDWKIPAGQIIRPKTPLTAASIEPTLADLAKKLQPEDSLWLLTLGHGDHDGNQARFHVSGRDPTGEDWPRWLADFHCREQVLWLTHSSSGWLVKPLSKPGRVVIAATEAAEEINETEFPQALAKVLQSPPKDVDVNSDGQVSLAELFTISVKETNARFAADKRIATEHAQLDDDGDGRGSETISANDPAEDVPKTKQDGAVARTIIVPWPTK